MKKTKKIGIFSIAIIVILTLAILLPNGLGVCFKETVDAMVFAQEISPAVSEEFVVQAANSQSNLTNKYNTAQYITQQAIEDSTITNILIHGEQLYGYNDFLFDDGVIDNNYSFSSTFYNGENIGELSYKNGNLLNAVLSNNRINYEYTENTITLSVDGGNTYLYTYDNNGNLISKSKNGVLLYTYIYENDKLTKAIDNSTNFAYEVIINNGIAQSYKKYLYRNNRFFSMSNTPYGEIPASVNQNISYTNAYVYNGENYISSKIKGDRTYNYDYINNVIVKESITRGDNTYCVDYIFDSSLNRLGFIYNNVKYYYIYDVCGNVLEVLNENSDSVLQYTYDILGKATVSGTNTNLAEINSYAFRAKDNWYFDYSTQQYYIGNAIVFNSQYAKTVASSANIPLNFINNPNKYSIWDSTSVLITPSLQHVLSETAITESRIVDQISSVFQRQSLTVMKSIMSFDSMSDRVSNRVDLYLKDYANSDYGEFNGQVYKLINNNFSDSAVLTTEFLQDIVDEERYIYDGENSFIPAVANIAIKGHFIASNSYVKYYSDTDRPSIIYYDVMTNVVSNYDNSFGNLYNYDSESYVLFFGSSTTDENMIRVGNLGDVIDYDAIKASIEAEINTSPSDTYQVSEITIYYISPEYINALYYSQQQNLYLGGRTAEQMRAEFGDDWSFTMYNGELIHSSQVPQDVQNNDGFNWGKFFKKIAIGAGCILVAATITAVTGGAGLACFAATAATLAGVSSIGGVIGGVVKGVETNSWQGFGEGFAEGFEFTAITTSIAQAGGAVLGVPPISACFVSGTPIATAAGQVNIEQICAGDSVLSYNFTKNIIESKTVTKTFVRETNEIYEICLGSEIIHTTSEHPFYVKDVGWTTAECLKQGDTLITSTGEINIAYLNKFLLDAPTLVYNFEVEDNHNYYVGNDRVLVHNTCGTQVFANSNISASVGEAILVGTGIVAGGIAVGGLVGGIDAGVINLPTDVFADKKGELYTPTLELSIASAIAATKLNPQNEQKIYYEIIKVNSNMPNRILLLPVTYEVACEGVHLGKSYLTLYSTDARMILLANYPTYIMHIKHYHPSVDGIIPAPKVPYLGDDNDLRSIHSFFISEE